jgi:hypothetical protein
MKRPLWERLPNELRSRVDELIADDRKLAAMVAIRDTLDEPRPGIYECMDLLAERYAELDQPWCRPSTPLDIDVLARQVAALPHSPDAIEALWDGDSDGWFVCLVAVTLRPKFEHNLAFIKHGTDMRIYNGKVPPWPEALEARLDEYGRGHRIRLTSDFGAVRHETRDLRCRNWSWTILVSRAAWFASRLPKSRHRVILGAKR